MAKERLIEVVGFLFMTAVFAFAFEHLSASHFTGLSAALFAGLFMYTANLEKRLNRLERV